MSDRPVVVVTRRLPEAVESRLARHFTARFNHDDHPFTRDELRGALAAADGVLCTVTDPFDASVLGVEPLRARILANYGVGHNHIDLDRARARGIVVTNTPGVLTEATADLAIALMLMVARRLGEGERELRRGDWSGWRPTHLVGQDVAGRTLGIIGLGRIGQAVARRAAGGFGMTVLSYMPRPLPGTQAQALGVTQVSLARLLAESDFVSIHAPATPETRGIISQERLEQMKEGAYLINTARGDLVDQDALVAALRAGRIAGAGLDVYADEPVVPPELTALENVVLLPHLGSATHSARVAMGMKAVANLEAWFAGTNPPDRVGE